MFRKFLTIAALAFLPGAAFAQPAGGRAAPAGSDQGGLNTLGLTTAPRSGRSGRPGSKGRAPWFAVGVARPWAGLGCRGGARGC